MRRRPDLDVLVEKHRLLDHLIEHNRNRFLSDWNCDNPFIERMLGAELSQLARGSLAPDSYIYFDEEQTLVDSIIRFHSNVEALSLTRNNVAAGPGSSSFLAAFAIWLRRSGYSEVYYVPPLYHTFYFLLESLDVNLTPISAQHAYEATFSMNLPAKHTVLLMCDPVWYAGKYVPATQVTAIADWQRSTRSLVFVDGSFQYMKWGKEKQETTAILDTELTFRLVCPAKALAVPLFRFAYLLHPSSTHEDLLFLYESIVGGASASDLAFGHRALNVMATSDDSRVLPEYFMEVYSALIERRLVRTTVAPECGYFAFAAPTEARSALLQMDESYFELSGYPGYCRINLMAADRIYQLTGKRRNDSSGDT